MRINGKEIRLKITPKAIEKCENSSCGLDILKLLRESEISEPKASDYYKLIYAGYIGSTNESIEYEDFLELLEKEGIDLPEISRVGVDLLLRRKN